MEYFVSIENSPYMRWQAALLHESFRMKGLEDKLLIACAENESRPELHFGRVMYHKNIGAERGYKPLNRPYGMIQALERGLISQPFVAIEADMVLRNPLPQIEEDIGVNWIWYMEWDQLYSAGWKLKEWFGVEKEKWQPGGCIYLFKNAPDHLFDELFGITEEFAERFDPDDGLLRQDHYWMRDMTAFGVALARLDASFYLNRYESYMDPRFFPGIGDKEFAFVHYANGVTGYFDKRQHNPDNWFGLSAGPLPFETIMAIPEENKAVDTMKAVVESYLGSDPDLTLLSQ